MISYYKQVCKLPEGTGKQSNLRNTLHAQTPNLHEHLWQPINAMGKEVRSPVHMCITWTFSFVNRIHNIQFLEPKFQLTIIPFKQGDRLTKGCTSQQQQHLHLFIGITCECLLITGYPKQYLKNIYTSIISKSLLPVFCGTCNKIMS